MPTINKDAFIPGILDKYPERLLEGRVTAEGNFCGLLLKDLTRYDDIGADVVSENMVTKDGRFLFNIGKNLRMKGFAVLDEVSLLSNIDEGSAERIAAMGGYKTINHLMEVLTEKNWDAVFDTLLKGNVLLRLYDNGFNSLQDFRPAKRDEKGNAFKCPLDLFKTWNSQEVLAYYEEKVASCSTDVRSDMITSDSYLDFDEDFISGLQKGVESGTSFGSAGVDIDGNNIRTFSYLSNDLLGYKHGTLNGIGAASGVGKSSVCITIIFSLIAQGEKVLIINNEMSISDYKCMMLVWIANRVFNRNSLTKKKLMSGNLNVDDLELIAKIRTYWREHYAKSLKIVTLTDANMKLSMQIAKKEILRNGITTVLLDTFKLTIDSNARENFWMQLVEDCRQYTKLCVKYNVIGLLTIQLAIATTGQLFLDASCLSNSKAIKETLSTLILLRNAYPIELVEGSPYYLAPFWHVQKDGKWVEEPQQVDMNENYTVLFVDKNRRGVDTGSNGIAYLLKKRLDYAVFKESAKCRPVHKNISKAE